MDITQLLVGTGGIAGILAVFIFYLVRQMRTDRKFMEDRLTKIIEADQESREKHTTVLTELITWLKARNGSR